MEIANKVNDNPGAGDTVLAGARCCLGMQVLIHREGWKRGCQGDHEQGNPSASPQQLPVPFRSPPTISQAKDFVTEGVLSPAWAGEFWDSPKFGSEFWGST